MNLKTSGGRLTGSLTVSLCGLLSCVSPAQAAPATVYSYDLANHLIQATATTGSGIQYRYDPSGNLLSVTAVVPTAVALNHSQNISTGSAGQNAVLGFSASAGETVTLNFGSIATIPSGSSVNITVYDSNGALVGSGVGSSTQSPQLTLVNLAGGSYTVIAAPQNGATATLQLASSGSGTADAPIPAWSYSLLGALPLWQSQRARRATYAW